MNVERLGNIFKITSGGTPNRSIKEYYDGGTIPWVKTGDLKVKDLYQVEECITESGLENSSAKIFPKNTILIAMYGATIGACSILRTEAATNQACAALLPNEKVETNYLYYYLMAIKPKLIDKGVGGGQPNISATILKEIEFPFPDLKSQQEIAQVLEQADKARRQRKAANALTDQFLQSSFLFLFGDPNINPKGYKMKKLGDVTNIIMGQSPDGDSYNYNGNGEPLLNGPTEFGMKYPKEKQWTTKPTKFSKAGDILFCVRGATAGRMNWSDKKYCIGRGLAAISTKSELSNEFIYSILESKYDFFQSTGHGSTFINISRDMLSDLLVPMTSEKEQQQFAGIVAQAEQLRQKQRESERELETLFQALLQRYFG